LRKFHNHKKRINALEYQDNDLYSAGDDFIIRHYDVAAGQVVHSYDNAHTDYIKAIKALENNHILSGAYDGIVKLFDFRVHEKAQLEFKHEEQIESMDLYPSKLSFIVGGGNKVSIWDIRTGKAMFEGRNNKKVVTNVKLISQGSRYITTSLDHYLKVFKSDSYEMTYQ
jgi:U3 small nucleolar RNA-associated protein 15